MTRRERMEARAARRRAWAGSASTEAAQRDAAARDATSGIPLGQPILVGHHSERRHRRTIERADANMGKALEATRRAERHESIARTLERRLDHTIFSDDADAIEALEARIAQRERERERTKAIAKAWRKGGRDAVAAVAGEKIADACARTMAQCRWLKSPVSTRGIGAAIRKDRERIEQIKRERAKHAAAAAAGGVLLEDSPNGWCSVTFAEKPEREILRALKASGFHWSGGGWHGKRDRVPAPVLDLLEPAAAAG